MSSDLLEWADDIFVMEKRHARQLQNQFGKFLKNKRIVSLNIPDDYEPMQPELVEVLKVKVSRLLR